ncbi:MAG: tetratricopeptide repeat protein [Chloroflexi bacterium]|nr:tetratricopeptide repeat protein [Chloroflexota bacterium]MCC6893933.1 tetratricopeptide repeat protein [Anaerolineae bacterium]
MLIQPVKPLIASISALVASRIGLMPTQALHDAIEEVGGDDLGTLARTLETSTESSAAWQAILRTLMIGETYFFRQQTQLGWLRHTILPDLLKRRSGDITIWSAGCATGEEVYSLAMTLHENRSPKQRPNVRLIGSDLNRTSLDVARRGIYRDWSFRHTPAETRDRYFDRHETGAQIRPFIRQMVTFTPNNLIANTPITNLDVICCCNVLMYLHEQAVRRVEDNFFDALTPGGWLLLGQAENVRAGRERWLTHLYPGGVAYQKPLLPAAGNRVVYHQLQPRQAAPAQAEPLPVSLHEEAIQLLRAEQPDEAEQTLRQLLATQPNDVRAHILLGYILANRRQTADAHAELDAALGENPLNADAHYLKGMLYLDSDQEAAAQNAFKSALYCQNGHPLTALVLGNLYTYSGDKARARRVWLSAMDILNGAPDQMVSDLNDLTVGAMRDVLQNLIDDA